MDEMKSVAGDALEIQRRNLLSEAQVHNFKRHQSQHQEHLQEYQRDVQCHVSEVQTEVQSQQVASREEVGIMRRDFESVST